MRNSKMPIEGSRGALFSYLTLFVQLVNCGFWRNVAWTSPEDSNPGNSPQPVQLPPSPAIVANQSVQPSPTYSPGCQATVSTCTVTALVSLDSVPFFSRNSKMNQSVSLFYWPQESTNTACLATAPSPPSAAIPSGLNP